MKQKIEITDLIDNLIKELSTRNCQRSECVFATGKEPAHRFNGECRCLEDMWTGSQRDEDLIDSIKKFYIEYVKQNPVTISASETERM